jgi:hypothetical protein
MEVMIAALRSYSEVLENCMNCILPMRSPAKLKCMYNKLECAFA